MEPNLSSNQNENIKNRSDADRIKPKSPLANGEADSLPKDPVYQSRPVTPSANLSESYEGFSSSGDVGMKNLENSEGYGARYQMPETGASEGHLRGSNGSTNGRATASSSFVDLQSSLHAIEDLVRQLREKLMSPEQEELEGLLRQGSDLLTTNWKQLTSVTSSQVSTLKEDLRANPYRGLMGALRIGMAISQIISTRSQPRVETPVQRQAMM